MSRIRVSRSRCPWGEVPEIERLFNQLDLAEP